ncbi:MAG: glycoside hydrolase family 9 protein [Ignavibacteriales bacterium]|nr:glycoside hydrolase family 9 protein [Ignavibacteriales bacterium]
MICRWPALSIILAVFSCLRTDASVVVNQAGYLTNGQKTCFVTTAADSFRVIASGSGIVTFSGPLSLWKSNDAATGLTVYKGDFSSFHQSGAYYIAVAPTENSPPFFISDTVFSDVYRKALKGFYFQRCGIALDRSTAGDYARDVCHTLDGVFHSTSDTAGFKFATGGWHDAGDYGKYIVNAGVTVGTLLMAYELFPERFSQDNLGIPESGNGTPDILDEIQYELRWMLKMQHWSGGVYCKLTRAQFEGFIMPASDVGATRYIFTITSTATGDFAAVCAKAARLYKSFDPFFADSCLTAAKRAWGYLQSHTTIVPSGGFKNPIGVATGEYGDANDADERLWASAELYSTTGEIPYHTYYTSKYSSGALLSQTMSWPNVGTLAHLAYFFTRQSTADAAIKTSFRQSLLSYASQLVGKANTEGFGVAIKPGEYSWGSNSEVLNRAILLIIAARETKMAAYTSAALSQFDYILGKNAHNISFVTGVGVRHVLHPHHRPSAADGIMEPVPGLLAGGPDQFLDDAVLKAKFTASTPAALCYADDQESYASNEIAINWNAPLVFVAGYFTAEGSSTGVRQGSIDSPATYDLLRSYPNPFNPSARICFTIPGRTRVSLKVYDSLGSEMSTLVNEVKDSGDYSIQWDGSGHSSGLYWCKLEAGTFSKTIKLVLLR